MKILNAFINKNFFKTFSVFLSKLKFIPAMLFMLGIVNANAIDVQSIDSLLDQNIVLDASQEYHITNTTNAMTNSTVNMTNVDAWLFFDNIRPAEVVTKYKSSIKINGSTLIPGTNGRVAIYKHGTAIIPHGSDFKPLTVFTEKEFQGEQNSYSVNVYNTNLGTFDNAIQSFKLKRGYMVTFANSTDGSGYSRVFIANDADLEINIPSLLSNKVSFIRVLKYEWVTKKGWAGWDSNDIALSNCTWRYDWDAGGESTYNVEYVPIKQNLGWPSWTTINDKNNISSLLGYNEPDHTEQSDVTVDEAIAAWPDFMKSGLRLGAPATTDFNWVIDFVNRCDELNYRVDFVAVHAYWGNDPSSYYSSLNWVHEATGRPIWITEWNYGANWTSEWWPDDTGDLTEDNEQYAYEKIKAIVDFFDETPWIERYSIYNWVEDRRAIVLNGQLTKAGEYYANDTSVEAFNKSYEVIPRWTAQEPYIKLVTSVPSLQKHLIQWVDPNKELTDTIVVERRINDGDFVEIFSTTNTTTTVYQDPYQEGIQGTVQYRIKCIIANGSTVYSEVGSVSVTSGKDSIQVAKFIVSNFDDQTCVFPHTFTNDPSVILGPISYRNSKPQLTKRISKLGDDKVNMRVETWAFQADEIEDIQNKPESISFLALPDGNYDMNGITAEVKKVASVNGSWKQVTFDLPFETTPVVFCTQLTDVTSFPTTVRIKNVTTTGFQVCLQKEATQTSSISSETISYLAATEGTGVIDSKKIVVGKAASLVGNLYKQVQVNVDASYTEPAFFAETQTANDNVTSSLRYYDVNLNKKVFKQPETSDGTPTVEQDELGYMIIDMAAGQFEPVQATSSKSVSFYPNPAKNVLYFDINSSSRIEIYDLTGSKIIDKNVTNQLDIESLKSGIYLIFVNGKPTGKFMKM